MVRTRAKKVSNVKEGNSVEESEQAWNIWLMDFHKQLDDRLRALKLKVQTETEDLDHTLMLLMAQIPSDEAKLTVSQLSKDEQDSMEFFNSTLSSTVKKGGKALATSTAYKSVPPPPAKTTRQSRTQTKRNRTSSLTDVSNLYLGTSSNRRMTRSSSQPREATRVLPSYQTPMHKGDRPPMGSVTPKVDPYCPMPLKRYARQGEMAISLTGSPLMVTTNITEPNISLPLNNGQQVYSILPTSGPCPDIPSIDFQTREKLKILRENLDRILGGS